MIMPPLSLIAKYQLQYFLLIISLSSCAIPNELDPPGKVCEDQLSANKSIAEVKELAAAAVHRITEDWIIEGYIISSDQAGNFFNTLHVQEGFFEGALGFQLDIELRNSHLQYPPGTKVYVRLKGLHAGTSNGMLKIGSARNSFGNLSISRIPTLKLDEHLILSCDESIEEKAGLVKINSLGSEQIGTLIKLEQVEFFEEVLDLSFAEEGEETERQIRDCEENTMALLNSGYSSFQGQPLPDGNGLVRGVLLKKSGDYYIKIRDTSDLLFESNRCQVLFPLITSNKVFISEIADPDNNNEARFIELYNSGDKPISLSGWTLKRYTNANIHSNAIFDLSGTTIEAKSTLVIASNEIVFQEVYNMPADLVAGSNSIADSNGDDNFELVDPFNSIVDQFGVPGEDGTGTNHEFEDGGAFRKLTISRGNPKYSFDEWLIYNDSGKEGTELKVLTAPDDYTPGNR